MVTHISRSPEETREFGARLAQDAESQLVVGLIGDLGAGKTQLVKGFAEALGAPARVHSPTFTLVNEYPGGRLPLFHLDLYRLEGSREIRGAGLEVYLPPQTGVAIVEWFDRLESDWELPKLQIVRIHLVSESERMITVETADTPAR